MRKIRKLHAALTISICAGVASLVLALGQAPDAYAQSNRNQASKTPTAGIDAPPRKISDLEMQRPSYQDSVLQGGNRYTLPGSNVTIPDACTLNPALAGCPGYCAANPTAPGCAVVTPPPVLPPVALPRGVIAGCYVDTNAYDQYSNNSCMSAGHLAVPQSAAVFGIGDELASNMGQNFYRWKDAAAFNSNFRVEWTGDCVASGNGCSTQFNIPTHWANYTFDAIATIYRLSDGAVMGRYPVKAQGYLARCAAGDICQQMP